MVRGSWQELAEDDSREGLVELVRSTPNIAARSGRALGFACALGMVVTVGLAACSGGTTVKTPTPTASASPTKPSGTTVTPTTPPTLTPASTAPAEAGAGDICDQQTNVAAAVPSSIPAYPGAQLHISYITTSDGNNDGLFGYCSNASASAVAVFYAQQLPGKGWGSIQTSTLGDHQQVAATMGSSQVAVTAWPDSTLSGTTDILITAQGI